MSYVQGRPQRDSGPPEWGMGGLGRWELGLSLTAKCFVTSKNESMECPIKG